LCASYGLKAPDAIHAAIAIYSRASLFLTNDPIFKRLQEVASLVLDDLL